VRRAALRLALHIATATFLVTAAMIAVVGVLLVRDADTEQTAHLAITADRADDVEDPPADMWIVMRTGRQLSATHGLPAGLPLVAALDRVASGGPPDDTAVSIDGHDYRVRTQARPGLPGTQVQVVLDEAPTQAQRFALLRALAAAGLVGLVLTAALGVWLGVRAVRPLQAALALQRRFVTDAGHELRTPLTLLSTRAQMLRRKVVRPDIDDAVVTREVDSVVADAGHLAAILDDLLLVADLRSPVDAAVNVVSRHGGTVTAANAPDGGASFRIALPSATTTGSRRLPFATGPRNPHRP
jgi:signal transduction histidine kinase